MSQRGGVTRGGAAGALCWYRAGCRVLGGTGKVGGGAAESKKSVAGRVTRWSARLECVTSALWPPYKGYYKVGHCSAAFVCHSPQLPRPPPAIAALPSCATRLKLNTSSRRGTRRASRSCPAAECGDQAGAEWEDAGAEWGSRTASGSRQETRQEMRSRVGMAGSGWDTGSGPTAGSRLRSYRGI